jgi:hypothetical protein
MATRSDRVSGSGVKAAQSGGVSKSMPSKPKSPGSKGTGLSTAWGDQTKRPSVLTDMSAAKKRVR